MSLFKYSILISLHYYHKPLHCERISKLLPYEELYVKKLKIMYYIYILYIYIYFSLTPSEFEGNDNNISLNIYDKNLKEIYRSKTNSPQVANITQIGNRHSALKIQKVHMLFKKY